ncbi:unnamed protein product [Amoebophrya sp. A120]|nr:unnamed protein product [Amoebophrya sp. A120]|eukprot:GSA120T00011631001.1
MPRREVQDIKVLHTTRNFNKVLPGHTHTEDADIGMKAIWCYIVPTAYHGPIDASASSSSNNGPHDNGRGTAPCCEHHPRRISLPASVLEEFDEDSTWSLYYVNETKGAAAGHCFFKYILFPDEKKDRLLTKCKGYRKYEPMFTGVPGGEVHDKLAKIYQRFFGSLDDVCNENGRIVWHFHVGILGGTPFSTYVDENTAEWEHMKPDLPAIHQANATQDDEGDGASVAESEIFRKFAFENDEQGDEGDWQLVKNDAKAKEGCLPFCFESNQNIFPDENGTFFHYCRAEALWQCKRKGCRPSKGANNASRDRFNRGPSNTTASTATPNDEQREETAADNKPIGAKTTEWFSSCCWYHEHLKDKETQGLKKGFERQYCNECWNRGREWVEGKVLAFGKVGSNVRGTALDDEDMERFLRKKAMKTGPHKPDVCHICHRLGQSGFSGTCIDFADLLAHGFVDVREGSTQWHWSGGVSCKEEADAALSRMKKKKPSRASQ